MVAKLMNCCKPEPKGTQGYAKLLKRIQVLEDGGIPAKEARSWRIQRQKFRITKKEYQRLVNKFEMEGFMAQKGLWNLAKEKILRERGVLPKEEGDAVREYKAVHEENFLSSWAREDGREKEEGTVGMGNESKEERSEKRRREREKEENGTGSVKRRCDGFVSVEAFQNSSQGVIWRVVVICLGWKLLKKPENLSDCELDTPVDVLVVPDLTDVRVSPSSVFTEFWCGFVLLL